MTIEEKVIWQIAAGNGDRNYADILLDWDVVAVGPGHLGPFLKNIKDYG